MKALIYCRVMPDDKHVAKSDRLKSQEERCRKFCQKLNIRPLRCYRDQGDIHPVSLLPGIRSLLQCLAQSEESLFVVSDHHARLGLLSDTRDKIIEKIKDLGGQYIATHMSPSAYLESIGAELTRYLEGME